MYVTMYVSLYGEPLVIALAMAAVCQGPWVPLLRSCSAGLSSLIPPFHVAKHGGSSQGRPTILAIRSLAFTLDVRNPV